MIKDQGIVKEKMKIVELNKVELVIGIFLIILALIVGIFFIRHGIASEKPIGEFIETLIYIIILPALFGVIFVISSITTKKQMLTKDYLLTEPLPITVYGRYRPEPPKTIKESFLRMKTKSAFGELTLRREELIFKPSSFRLFRGGVEQKEILIKTNEIASVSQTLGDSPIILQRDGKSHLFSAGGMYLRTKVKSPGRARRIDSVIVDKVLIKRINSLTGK